MKLITAIALSVLMFAGMTLASPRIAHAHIFSGDESASFLALVEVMKVHLELVKVDLATNATTAVEHAEHAMEHLDADTIKEITERNERLGRDLPASLTELNETLESGNYTASEINEQVSTINDLLDETVSVRIENTQLTNSTVQGTMLADLVDEILESYNGAYGIDEEHEDGSMNMTEGESSSETDTDEGGEGMTMDETEHSSIVNMAAYEGAQALTARAQELFDTKLKALAESNATQAVNDLDAGLEHLKQAIDDKEPHDEINTIIHSEVHPNIQEAFNLQIIPEFPLPTLAVIIGIMSIIAYTRLGHKPRLA